VLVRNSWSSVDPGLRLRLRPEAPAGYFAAFPLGQAMDGIMAVGEVVESRPDGFSSGDTVSHAHGCGASTPSLTPAQSSSVASAL
jgi:NADPH-dependent curcumin reductase CurA